MHSSSVLPETAVRTVGAVVWVENGPKLCSSQEGFKPLAKHAELSWLFPEVTYGAECQLHCAFVRGHCYSDGQRIAVVVESVDATVPGINFRPLDLYLR